MSGVREPKKFIMTQISINGNSNDSIQTIARKKLSIHPEQKYLAYIENGIHQDIVHILELPHCDPISSITSSSILQDTNTSFCSMTWISYPLETTFKRKKHSYTYMLCMGTSIGSLIVISPEYGTVIDTISLSDMLDDEIITDQTLLVSLQSSNDFLWIGTGQGWIIQLALKDHDVVTTFNTQKALNGLCVTNNGSHLISWYEEHITVWELSQSKNRKSSRRRPAQNDQAKISYLYSHINSILDVIFIPCDQSIAFAFITRPEDQFIHIHMESMIDESMNWKVETLLSPSPIKHIFCSSLFGASSDNHLSLWKHDGTSLIPLTTLKVNSKIPSSIVSCFEFNQEQKVGIVLFNNNVLKLETCQLKEKIDREIILNLDITSRKNDISNEITTLTTPYAPIFADYPNQIIKKRKEKKQSQLELLQQKSISLSTVLSQALQIQDKQMLDMILNSSQHGASISLDVVDSTISQLGIEYVASLLSQIVSRLYSNPTRSIHLFHWIKAILVYHMSIIWTISELKETLVQLKNILEERVQSYNSLQKLSGRLEWILCTKEKNNMTFDNIQPAQVIRDANE